MSRYPSRSRAIALLKQAGCSENVIRHSITVADIATQMVKEIKPKENLDLELIEIGALLHDLGRSQTNGIDHGVRGASAAREFGLDDALIDIIANHVGAGIPAEEASKLGLPAQDYVPRTKEEKIVCYADKLAAGNRKTSFEESKSQLVRHLGPAHPAIKRLLSLHKEMLSLGIKDAKASPIGEGSGSG